MRSRRLIALGTAVLVLLLTACSEDREQPSSRASTPSTTQPAEPLPTPTPRASETASSLLNGHYENPVEGFAITFPESWRVQEDVFGVKVVGVSQQGSGGFATNLNVVVEPLSDPLPLADYAQAAESQLSGAVTDYEVVNEGRTRLAGRRAWTQTFTGTQGDTEVQFLQVVTVTNDRAYVLTFSAHVNEFEQARPQAQHIMATFDLL